MKLIEIKAKAKPAYLAGIEEHDAFFLVRLSGELDTHALEMGRDKMTAIIEDFDLYDKSILCDFGGVTEADTATVAVLVKRFSDFKKRGNHKMIFFNIRGELRELFEIAHLAELFLTSQTQEEAERLLKA